jgi:preprotein translocase subunit SecD
MLKLTTIHHKTITTLFLLLLCYWPVYGQEDSLQKTGSTTLSKNQESSLPISVKLPTGIYYVIEESTNTTKLSNEKDTLYVLNTPIVTVAEFKKIKSKADKYSGGYHIEITLNEEGKTKFYEASIKSYEKKLAIVVNGKLIMAPIVKSPISTGIFIITLGYYANSKHEVEKIKQQLEMEMNIAKAKDSEQKKSTGK